jgi:sterol desaturase/sphingolipid hydroxylase (fatty acid hydroxylase superfamily)
MEPGVWLADLGARVGTEMSRLLRAPLDSGQRMYWAYLLSALSIALVVLAVRHWRSTRKLSPLAALRELFSPRIWWHPSARLDYMLFALNPLMRALLAVGGLSMVPIALAVSEIMDDGWGAASLHLTDWQVAALFTLALFVADDFTRYWLHRLLHRVRALWALHRLHHSAEVLTPITVYRMHPLESALYSLRMVATQGIVVGVFFYLFGMRLSAWEVAGANVFTYAFNMAGSNLRHSHVWLSFGPVLERLVISPAQHQIHHSDRREHYDRNFGSFLAVWDWLFGTLTLARGQVVTGFGLGYTSNPFTGLARAWWLPVRDLASVLLGGRMR